MQVARIVAFTAIMLAATVLSGCAVGPGRLRREAAEPLPGRLIEPDGPSVVASSGQQSSLAFWKRPTAAAVPEATEPRPQLVAEAATAPSAAANPRRHWFQGWTLSPREIAANWRAGLNGQPPIAGGSAAGRRQATPMVTQTRATVDASTLPVVPAADAPRSPVVRASRLAAGKPVERLPVSITLSLPPRTDDDDRLASHEQPRAEPEPQAGPDPEPEPQATTDATAGTTHAEPSTAERPARSDLVRLNSFPEPALPPDLDDLDTILTRTHNGEALPTIAQEVPPDPDLDDRFQGRPRLSAPLTTSSATTLTMRGAGTRPVGLPARLPEPTYPEDRTRYGTMTGRATANPDQPQPQPQPPDTTARRRGPLAGLADAIGARLMRREPGNVAQPR